MQDLGKILFFLGIGLAVFGGLFYVGGKYFKLGRLPGDFFFQRDGFTFQFPLVSSIIISIVLTLLLTLISTLIARKH